MTAAGVEVPASSCCSLTRVGSGTGSAPGKKPGRSSGQSHGSACSFGARSTPELLLFHSFYSATQYLWPVCTAELRSRMGPVAPPLGGAMGPVAPPLGGAGSRILGCGWAAMAVIHACLLLLSIFNACMIYIYLLLLYIVNIQNTLVRNRRFFCTFTFLFLPCYL